MIRLFILVCILTFQQATGQDSSYLKIGNDTFPIHTPNIANGESFYKLVKHNYTKVEVPTFYDNLAVENESGDLILFKNFVPVDSVEIDFDFGSARIDSNSFKKYFDLKLLINGEPCWTKNIDLLLIDENTNRFEIHSSNDLWYVLNEEGVSKPKIIIIRDIQFFNSDIRQGYLNGSFLWHIE